MTVTVDENHKIELPNIKPGVKFDLHTNGQGEIVLKPIGLPDNPQEKTGGRIIVKNGRRVIKLNEPLDMDALNQALKEFP